jgi:hypothetical protein
MFTFLILIGQLYKRMTFEFHNSLWEPRVKSKEFHTTRINVKEEKIGVLHNSTLPI